MPVENQSDRWPDMLYLQPGNLNPWSEAKGAARNYRPLKCLPEINVDDLTGIDIEV